MISMVRLAFFLTLIASSYSLSTPSARMVHKRHAIAIRAPIPEPAPEPPMQPWAAKRKRAPRQRTSCGNPNGPGVPPSANLAPAESPTPEAAVDPTPAAAAAVPAVTPASPTGEAVPTPEEAAPPSDIDGASPSLPPAEPASSVTEPVVDPPPATVANVAAPPQEVNTSTGTDSQAAEAGSASTPVNNGITGTSPPAGGNTGGPSNAGGSPPPGANSFSGDATYYDAGLGACGRTNSDSDLIAAAGFHLFDSFLTDGNPNNNPICGKTATVSANGKTISVQIVDRCPGCDDGSLDLTKAGFLALFGDLGVGRGKISWVLS